ncbi:MAG: gliding motility protein GldC [Chitinophagaceae bacterium]|nr:gliding motility protein GldC [Chitinophagaceae bacterium]
MQKSTITINVTLDPNKMVQEISWNASSSTAADQEKAKAMMLALWDGQEKSAMHIELWTKEMMVDEMGDFFYQTLMTMANTYNRATKQTELVEDIKKFADEFYKKSRALLQKS